MHAAFAGQARLLGRHAHAVCVGVNAGQILKDGQMTQPQLARHGHGEEEVAALAAGDCDAVVIDGIVSGYYM